MDSNSICPSSTLGEATKDTRLWMYNKEEFVKRVNEKLAEYKGEYINAVTAALIKDEISMICLEMQQNREIYKYSVIGDALDNISIHIYGNISNNKDVFDLYVNNNKVTAYDNNAVHSNAEDYFEELERNAENVESLYRKGIEMGMKNTQEFMDWQDRLNKVSYVHKEDL